MCSHAGLATHYIPSNRLEDVIESLSAGLTNLPSNNPLIVTKTIDKLLNQFRGELEPYTVEPLHDAIDRCFLAPNVQIILSRLKEFTWSKDEKIATWAKETLELLSGPLSPTAIQTTFTLLQRGSTATLKTAFRTELALAQQYFQKVDDIYNGIDAKLIQKHGKPTWQPSKIEQVDPLFIKNLFEKPSDPIDSKPGILYVIFISFIVKFYNEIDFEQYPHAFLSLPTSHQLRGLLLSKYRNLSSREALIDTLIEEHFNSPGKLGLKEHLERIIVKHVKYKNELDKKGHIPTAILNWI